MKQTLKIGVMLLVVVGLATTGIALAQSDDSPAVFDDETTTTDPALLRSRLGERITEWLAPLVEDDTITQEQADAVADVLAEHLPRPAPGVARGLLAIDEAADFLGMTSRELVEALRDGTTLAELAGDSADELAAHLLGVLEEHLDQAVTDGFLTEEQAAQRLDEAAERLTDLMNGESDLWRLPDGLGGRGHRGGGHFGPGLGDGPCGDDVGTGTGLSDLGA